MHQSTPIRQLEEKCHQFEKKLAVMVESEKSLQKFQTQLSDTYAESVTRVEHQNVLNKLRDSERQVVSYFRYLYQTLSKFTFRQVKSSKILTSSLVKICGFCGFLFLIAHYYLYVKYLRLESIRKGSEKSDHIFCYI